jgi:hypothetical protein
VDATEILRAIFITPIWMGASAQLIGMPIAWLRVRKTQAWRGRPGNVRRIDVLAKFMLPATACAIVWGWAVTLVALLGGLGFSDGALLFLLFAGPLAFVPWLVARRDLGLLPAMVG